MEAIASKLTNLIGRTPLLELNRFRKLHNYDAHLIAKLECLNPGRSIKDRIGLSLIEDAEAKGILQEESVIIEPTTGNTGIALALVAASKGYRLILTMPETMSDERRQLLKALGAELVLTPGFEGMGGAIRRAEELKTVYRHSFVPQQFQNPANPTAHRLTTAQEIWNDTDGNIDLFVAGVGTGGTITGTGEVLKQLNPAIKVIAVEPFESPVLSGGKPGPHKIQGIGPGFIPDVFNPAILDEIIQVKNEDAYLASRQVASSEGLLVGVSSGAVLWAAGELAKRKENKGKTIVVILPDTGERYLSTSLYERA